MPSRPASSLPLGSVLGTDGSSRSCAPQGKMFKYTPPWQVLCATLEPRAQGLKGPVPGAAVHWGYEEAVIDPGPEQQLWGQEDALDEEPSWEMDRVTRNPIFHLPQAAPQASPPGERKSQHSHEGHGGRQVENGHGWGSHGALEDASEFPADALDSGRDLWTPPPDRESKLEVVRAGTLYDLRAYRGEKKPSKLYEEDEEEQYRCVPAEISPEKAKELEEERQQVIKSQVVKKSSTTAERCSSVDELSSAKSTPEKSEAKLGGSRAPSFAICFDSSSPRRALTPVDRESIDTDQINFATARQQFLLLEKANPGSLFRPGQQGTSPKPESTRRAYEWVWQCPELFLGTPSQRGEDGGNIAYTAGVEEEPCAPKKADTPRSHPNSEATSFPQASSREDVGLSLGKMSTESSADYASDGSVSEVFEAPLPSEPDSQDGAKEPKARTETPIEREIRLALEREETLRKERGLGRQSSSSELVEIHTKPLLTMSRSPPPGRKGKDKGRASFYVQREIEQETQREEALKREGRLLGAYDKGPQQELGERRKVFEQDDATPAPAKSPEAPARTQTGAPMMSHGAGSMVDAVDLLSVQAYPPCQQDPSLEGFPGAGAEGAEASTRPAKPGVMNREYFSLLWKPKFSFATDQGSGSQQRAEQSAARLSAHEEQYTLKSWKPQAAVLIEEDIQHTLQREQELREERRRSERLRQGSQEEKGSPSPLSSPSSGASGISGSYLVSESPVFAPLSMNVPSPYQGYSGKSMALQSPPLGRRKLKQKDDRMYAGIEPSDTINTEVVESTRVIRHKNLLAQRWEAGQFANKDDD
ncbi:mitotic interactor and substrate of PLK1 isoform X1 [Alligator sinensis]|uniref:Mitotic interactor and substrate of PLK1 isoform X1 n=2 Tax=Alligator sinensis TaxID=38654 RepID=A0A3Q0G1G1_ALLSI|nr:mitotic interactor and substrate of PLK1 isoform X1 [Alligator sinensis]